MNIAPEGALGDEANKLPPAPRSSQPVLLPLLALLFLTLVTQLGSLTYNMWAAAQMPDAAEISIPARLIFGAVFLWVITIPLAGLGLLLGGRIGLGAPLLADLLQRRAGAAARPQRDAKLAILLGFGTGLILLLLRVAIAPCLPPELPSAASRPPLPLALIQSP